MDQLESYSLWSAVVMELLLDVETEEMTIVRLDTSQDTWASIDVVQVEGSGSGSTSLRNQMPAGPVVWIKKMCKTARFVIIPI